MSSWCGRENSTQSTSLCVYQTALLRATWVSRCRCVCRERECPYQLRGSRHSTVQHRVERVYPKAGASGQPQSNLWRPCVRSPSVRANCTRSQRRPWAAQREPLQQRYFHLSCRRLDFQQLLFVGIEKKEFRPREFWPKKSKNRLEVQQQSAHFHERSSVLSNSGLLSDVVFLLISVLRESVLSYDSSPGSRSLQ